MASADVDDHDSDEEIETQFDKIISGIKNGKHTIKYLANPKNEYHNYLNRKTDNEGCLLHKIARCDRTSIGTLKPLIQYLIENHSHLMKHKNTDGKTPLQLAIQCGVDELVKAMCDAVNAEELDTILSIPDSSKSNCLHNAMRVKRRNARDIALDLIGRVQNKALFTTRNQDEHTPLHIAVEYERCTEKQLNIVRKLVDTCYEALDVNVLSEDSRQISVYRHHQDTRQNYLARQNKIEGRQEGNMEKGQREKYQPSSKVLANLSAPQAPNQSLRRGSLISGKKPEKNSAAVSDFEPQLLGRKKTFVETDVGGNSVHGDLQIAGVSGKVGNPLLHIPGAQAQASAPETQKKDDEARRKKKEKEKMTEKWANEVRDLLKISFMRTREDHEAMVSFFYGPIQEKELFFSLVDGPSKCNEEMLKNVQYAEFEDTLQYVELPRLELEKPDDVPAKFRGRVAPKDGKGRNDYPFIFDWLQKKGVDRILKLYVDDSEEPSHSEETIENALEKFRIVQLWDWKKFDLSSETILKAAKDVEEVWLYWSGNNAVLRSWSEPDGLNALRSLRKVKVFETQFRSLDLVSETDTQKGLETRKRVMRNLNAFSERLKQNRGRIRTKAKEDAANAKKRAEESSVETTVEDRPAPIPPEITVEIERDSGVQRRHGFGTGLPATPGPSQDQHKWLSYMDKFADFHQRLELDDTASASLRPITVALIDDGFDIGERELAGKIIGGRSFCRSNSKNHHAAYFVTLGGHGTVMAKLICRAVRAAIDKKVDVISMSWTIDKPNTNNVETARLEAALDDAFKKDILLFCAASDQGPVVRATYPAASGRCIRIGAARASGQEYELVGGASSVDFLFPGHNVVPGQTSELDLRLDKGSLLSGSSVATALAAGLAALVLHCVQFAAQYAKSSNAPGDRVTSDDFARLKSRDGMFAAFQSIDTTEHKYVKVWDVFGPATKREDGLLTPEAKRQMIVDVARRLVQTKTLRVRGA
ncbi:hypothetical protein SLS58_007097 [Diplodia intermedia]|uniref:Peptidase S8/S53 domain-containing protein n=1 Tax=Diplodia intermedia TaxID=856260 RepID=A0ABR3TLD1_9PEZI